MHNNNIIMSSVAFINITTGYSGGLFYAEE